MSEASKKSAYGNAASDTSFRKTWDKDEYAAKAASREALERTEAKARYEAKSQGKKYFKPAPSDAPTTQTTARAARLNISSQIGKTQLVPATASTGKRGRGAGFYCEDCDLTFKDNLQWVDHLNSKQHLVATGQSGVVERVGVEAVRERLEMLRRKKAEEEQGEGEGLRERLERRRVEEERERELKREKRREKRRKKGKKDEVAEEHEVEFDTTNA
jgi:U4/U6.U5 tri-snRNP component SNU23